jgi:glycosyltransferase involved in cell wall biosynthesis
MSSSPPSRHAVSCVLPVFNEAAGILDSVGALVAALTVLTGEFEIIAVNDGSTDGTPRLLDEMAAREPRIRVVHFPGNLGYGAALRRGFAESRSPLVFFTDSDGQFDPMDLGRLLAKADEADLVVGYRAHRCDGARRGVLSAGYNRLVARLLPVRVRDVNCAFKLIHRRVLERVQLESDGYCINAELLAKAAARGMSITEVTVAHLERRTGQSKVRLGDIPRSFRELLWLKRRIEAM